MERFKIVSRWDAAKVLYEGEAETLKDLVGTAVKSGASLSRANLYGASLSRANLSGASLDGASLDGASLDGISGEKLTLVGTRPYFEIGPIGSRLDRLVAWMTDAGTWVRAGCWWGTLKAFKARIKDVYTTGQHGDEYRAAIRMVETHARLWTPAKAVDAAMSAKE